MYKIKIYILILYVVRGKCKFRMVKYQIFFLFDDLKAKYIYVKWKIKYLNERKFI